MAPYPPYGALGRYDMRLDPQVLLRAYAMGVFPMAEDRHSPQIQFVQPKMRGIFELDRFHISGRLCRRILSDRMEIRIDTAFDQVIDGCADRPETWINRTIHEAYLALYDLGHAHSLEVWQKGDLVGGVYGVTLGAAFFGESMFSRVTDASKVALAYLIHRLKSGGYQLFDTQFLTPHLASLGAIEIRQAAYMDRLQVALAHQATFVPAGYQPLPSSVAGSSAGSGSAAGKSRSGTSQRITQTS